MSNANSEPTPDEAPPRRRWRKWLIVVLIIAAAAGIVALSSIPAVWTSLVGALEKIQGSEYKHAAFAVLYILACVFMISGAALTAGAGIIFDVDRGFPIEGVIVVSIVSTIGACIAFLLGRTLLRQRVARKLAGNRKFLALDEAVAQEGFKIVLLTRLSPLFPFVLLNYAYGLTKVKFWKYALASWIGMLPGTIMYVYVGKAVGSLVQLKEKGVQAGTAGTVFFIAGLVVAIAVAVFVSRVAKKALARAVPQTAAQEPSGPDTSA